MEYAFIGGGNMGRALAAALIGQGVCLPMDILIIDSDPEAREGCRKMGLEVMEKSDSIISEIPVVILAVKPQSSSQIFKELKPLLKPEQVVISIMAGVTIAALKKGLKHDALIRVMPNMPAQIGLGMNVYFPEPSLNEKQLEMAQIFLKSSGEVLRVSKEETIDAATAISGSGPAYVFYIAEHWMNVAQSLGFSRVESETLIQQTLLGATALWKAKSLPVGTLKKQVTSKGGTTAAALDHFDSKSLGNHLEKGLEKAYQRAKELGG